MSLELNRVASTLRQLLQALEYPAKMTEAEGYQTWLPSTRTIFPGINGEVIVVCINEKWITAQPFVVF
jgi:hypothetical protein